MKEPIDTNQVARESRQSKYSADRILRKESDDVDDNVEQGEDVYETAAAIKLTSFMFQAREQALQVLKSLARP